MSSESFATTVLWLTWLSFPVAVFALGNSYRSRIVVVARAVVSVAIGWSLAVAYVMSAQALVAYGASPERLLELYESDSAPRSFAATFGWVPAFISVVLIWGTRTVWRRLRSTRQGL